MEGWRDGWISCSIMTPPSAIRQVPETATRISCRGLASMSLQLIMKTKVSRPISSQRRKGISRPCQKACAVSFLKEARKPLKWSTVQPSERWQDATRSDMASCPKNPTRTWDLCRNKGEMWRTEEISRWDWALGRWCYSTVSCWAVLVAIDKTWCTCLFIVPLAYRKPTQS